MRFYFLLILLIFILSSCSITSQIPPSTDNVDSATHEQEALHSIVPIQSGLTISPEPTMSPVLKVQKNIIRMPIPVPEYEGLKTENNHSYVGDYSIWLDNDTLLMFDFFGFKNGTVEQQIFFTASAPDFAPVEIFRETVRMDFSDIHSIIGLYKVSNGYLTTIDKDIVLLNPDGTKQGIIGNFEELLGDAKIINISPSPDASELLVCTYDGLVNINLKTKELTLIEDGIYEHYESEPIASDCNCGPDFNYQGAVYAEYSPNGSMYASIWGDEPWGSKCGKLTIRSNDGTVLFMLDSVDNFQWLNDGSGLLAAFVPSKIRNGNGNIYLIDPKVKDVQRIALPFPYDRYENPLYLKNETTLILGIGEVLDLESGNISSVIEPVWVRYNNTGLLTVSQDSEYVLKEFEITSADGPNREYFVIPLP